MDVKVYMDSYMASNGSCFMVTWNILKNHFLEVGLNGRGKPTASSLLADGFPLMAGPNFQPSDGNPIVISILRQLADGPKNVPEM
jgi:hypothetical protein